MLIGTNQDQGQRYNRRVVFDLVRLHGSLSRTDLARRAGLSYQSVSNMADSLILDGLLTETRKRSGRRGQPPVELSVNPEGGFSLGFSFDQRVLRGALVDLAGNPRAEIETRLDTPHPATVLPAIAAAACELAFAEHATAERLLGLGLGMPGVSRQGRLISPAPHSAHAWLRSWVEVPIVDTLQKLTGIAVFTDNDASAAAIGELLYGEGRPFTDFMYIYISNGIGSGLILGRRPYRGANGLAGEFGHMTVEVDGRPCPCGRTGCLESYASLQAAWQQVNRPGDGDDPSVLVQRLAQRDPAMMQWIAEAGRMLRQAIVSVENFLDPQVVFIGGTIPQPILDALIEVIQPLPPRIATATASGVPRLIKAKVGLGPATLGAAALPMFEETASDISLLLKSPNIRVRTAS